MERKKRLNTKGLRKVIASVALVAATILVFTGCSGQVADVRENQLNLQNMVQANAQQIATDAARIEAIIQAVNTIDLNQRKLQEQIVAVQNDTQMMRDNMIIILRQLKEDLSSISAQISSAGLVKK